MRFARCRLTLACCSLALLLPSASAQAPQTNLYVQGWSSPIPVSLTRVEVTGGALVQVLSDASGQSGTISASAERACLTIEAWGADSRGVAVHFAERWDAQCDRVYLPMALGS